jgi:glycosyltransferase involved in cell wall biosynthesis
VRILFDARSVRTPAGRYVLRGLTSAWQADSRVEAVVVASPTELTPDLLPEGIEAMRIDDRGWVPHVTRTLPRAADRARADVIFAPNALAPKDPRSVLFFQDLHHFRASASVRRDLRAPAVRIARWAWRKHASSEAMLAVCVSRDIEAEVARRLKIPVVMIPNGVDVSGVRWQGGADEVFVLGGIGARKGEALALRAWTRAVGQARNMESGLRIGGVEPAPRRTELESLAESLGVADRVRVEGLVTREQYLQRIATSRLAVSCSSLEAFGLPVAEAILMGAPVLASDTPAHVEHVRRAGAGELFSVDDEDMLVCKIRRSLDGTLPVQLRSPVDGWGWETRGRAHIDLYEQYVRPGRTVETLALGAGTR